MNNSNRLSSSYLFSLLAFLCDAHAHKQHDFSLTGPDKVSGRVGCRYFQMVSGRCNGPRPCLLCAVIMKERDNSL